MFLRRLVGGVFRPALIDHVASVLDSRLCQSRFSFVFFFFSGEEERLLLSNLLRHVLSVDYSSV